MSWLATGELRESSSGDGSSSNEGGEQSQEEVGNSYKQSVRLLPRCGAVRAAVVAAGEAHNDDDNDDIKRANLSFLKKAIVAPARVG